MKSNLFKNISVVIPIFNEGKNIPELIKRLNLALLKTKKSFELIFVDDNSNDDTDKIFEEFRNDPKIITIKKDGKRGKAFSLIQGFEKASGDIIVMIDGDLQYPPEALPEMIKALDTTDVVIANRKHYRDSAVRKLFSKTFRFVFGGALFGLNHDIQSGLKVFTREVFETVKFTPVSAWTFDLEFLHRAKQAGFSIHNFDIVFSKRKNGHSKVAFIKTTFEIGFNALCLRAKRIHPAHIPPKQEGTMLGAGIGYKKKKYITHTTISHQASALKTFTALQKLTILIIVVDVALGFYIRPLLTLQLVVAVLSLIYFLDVIFNLYLIGKSLSFPREIISSQEELDGLREQDLPMYTILCPLYREAQIIPQFLEAMSKLSYPREKLDIILLLEEDDKESIEQVGKINLPSYVRSLIVPHSIPKTKPKACNYGLAHARGEYLVIYDAEDIPDTMQLKKAYLGFGKVKEDVICLQAKLNYYNPHQNLLTRFFTAEYSLWFDVTLTGLQSIGTTIPLGGTSNHFRIENLRQVEGWDPFNVTEDADLGVRLFRKGYKTAMIDSTTLEEANSKVGNWFRQRSRWIKGYMQTYLVHTRHTALSLKGQKRHSLIFQLLIGGKIAFVLINPFLWVATFSYFALYAYVGPAIEALYPSVVFYIAVTSLVFGNFLFLYDYMIGLAKKGQWNLIKFVFLIPLYWLMISISAFIALYQLIFKPHYWEKTVHGFHLQTKRDVVVEAVIEVERESGIVFPAKIKDKLRLSLSKKHFVGAVFVLSMAVGSFLNFLYNVYLGRVLRLEDFALISLVGGLYSFVAIAAGSFGTTVGYKTGYLLGKKNEESAFFFWKKTRKKLLFTSLILGLLWIGVTPFLANFFREPNAYPLILFAPVIFVSLALAADRGFLSSKLGFGLLAILVIFEPALKLITSASLVWLNLGQWAYAAIPLSVFSAFILAWIFANSGKRNPDQKVVKDSKKFPKRFLFVAFVSGLSTVILLNIDVVLAKHYLSPADAGLYALVSLAGKMIFFLGSLATPFIIPLVSRNEGGNKDSKKVLNLTLAGVFALVVPGAITLGVFGDTIAPILFGTKILPVVSYFLPISFAMLCFSLSRVYIDYYLAKKHYTFSLAMLSLGLLQVFLIVSFHNSISSIVYVTSGVWASSLLLIITLHTFSEKVKIFENNVADFLGLFALTKKTDVLEEGRFRILILNWRDTRHKWAGGAESYVHELAKRWVREGNTVTLFCGNDSHCLRNEVVNGVNIVRRGGLYTVYLWGFLYYILKFRGKYDVIVDSENGLPFFAPLYVKAPVLLLIHHIHQEVFRRHLKFPLSAIARFLEGSLMPRVYRNNQVITVSQSSKDDILKLGLGKKNDVSIVYPGIESSLFKKEEKAKNPLFAYIGRLKPYKNVDVAIKAFAEVAGPCPEAQLLIIGEGETSTSLQGLTHELNIENNVTFTGRVSDVQKARLLARSWVVLQPSMIEGWGITVIEANAAGTPVIASDVNGLRDSVVNGQTGTLVPVKDVDAFAHAMMDFIVDAKYRKTLSDNAYSWSKNFSWDDSSKQFFLIVADSLRYSKIRSNRIQLAVSKLISIFL